MLPQEARIHVGGCYEMAMEEMTAKYGGGFRAGDDLEEGFVWRRRLDDSR